MNENFNVGNPTKENIDFAFKNLIFYITASIQLDIYKEQKKNFEKVLVEINTILATYVNKESLISINEEKLQNIKFDLIDLDTETKSLKFYFAAYTIGSTKKTEEVKGVTARLEQIKMVMIILVFMVVK